MHSLSLLPNAIAEPQVLSHFQLQDAYIHIYVYNKDLDVLQEREINQQ